MTNKYCTASFILIFCITAALSANPFFGVQQKSQNAGQQETGTQQSENTANQNIISPVRTGAANKALIQPQNKARQKIADTFLSWKTASSKDRTSLIVSIIFVSFIYGIIHAAGPGHRKTIVFSLYLVRRAPRWEPCCIGLTLSMLHGGCAIILMLLFKTVSGSIAGATNTAAIYLEGFSYLLVILTAVVLLISAAVQFIKTNRQIKTNETHITNTESRNAIKLIPFIISGIYPCPGAILVLILSFTQNILGLGIISVTAMSIGMAIPIIAAGYLAWFGKTGLFRLCTAHKTNIAAVSFIAESAGCILLIAFSVYIAYPFFASLF